ncbi:uncharacterized protein LOC133791471 [Humulus lupulus]|uniref:uncharacterized protein LOC133791471 n=1 Tax=Humulus lupulus TaxID=3486 RepID=UPI002B4109DB|nr:uncharacterized protein LOC133791471 [Humulus lupulus]
MDSTVFVAVLYDGVWAVEGFNWVFNSPTSKMLMFDIDTTLEKLCEVLYEELDVDPLVYELKLEVCYMYMKGTKFPPKVLVKDSQLRVFFSMKEKMSVDNLLPLFVTKVKKNVNLEPTPPSVTPRSVVGTFVPETDQGVSLNEQLPNNIDDHRANIAFDHLDEFDGPYYSDDPVVDLDEDDDVELEVDGAVQVPPLRLELTPSNQAERQRRPPRSENHQTPGTSSSRPGPSISTPASEFEVCTKFKPLMWTREDIEENHVYTTSLSGTPSGEIHLGKLYTNKEEFKNVVGRYALKKNFEWMVRKSGTDVLYVTCKDQNCKWRLRGRKKARCDMFEVTVFHNEHTCNLNSRNSDHRQAAPWVIGRIIKEKYTSVGTKYMAKDIQSDMFKDYGIKISYEKAWRCREKALTYVRGTPAESYTKLYGYLYMLEQKNPGTITDIVREDDRFKYCFWSLDACRRGFKFCRPVISIDGTFLKTKYGGTMLLAVAYDANNQLFPMAFAIVDSENHDSWKYFLQKLREAIGEVENLVYVSDRHQSIEHAVEVVFPEACHCFCFKHITMNVTFKFKIDVCNTQIWLAAYAWSKIECDRHFEVLKRMDPPIATYVEQIGLEKWARPYCPGDRYNIMTSNAAESFNNVTEEFRKYPITTLVEFTRFTLQNWFADRLENASKCTTPLATTFEKDLKAQHEDGRFRTVYRNGAQLFNVGTGPEGQRGGDVDLVERTCTCGMFQSLKIPCPHACAAAISQNASLYALSSPYYTKDTWKKTYDATINVVGEEDDWVLPEHIKNMRVGVPVDKKPVGRPRKSNAGRRPTKRRPSNGQVVVEPRHCTNCGGSGHNRATCKARV